MGLVSDHFGFMTDTSSVYHTTVQKVRIVFVDAHERKGRPVAAYLRVQGAGGRRTKFKIDELVAAVEGSDNADAQRVEQKLRNKETITEDDLRVIYREASGKTEEKFGRVDEPKATRAPTPSARELVGEVARNDAGYPGLMEAPTSTGGRALLAGDADEVLAEERAGLLEEALAPIPSEQVGPTRIDLRSGWPSFMGSAGYSHSQDEIFTSPEFEEKDRAAKVRAIRHEFGHRYQLTNPEEFEEFKEAGLGDRVGDVFSSEWRAKHERIYRERQPDALAAEVFAESYARHLSGDLDGPLEDFWSGRGGGSGRLSRSDLPNPDLLQRADDLATGGPGAFTDEPRTRDEVGKVQRDALYEFEKQEKEGTRTFDGLGRREFNNPWFPDGVDAKIEQETAFVKEAMEGSDVHIRVTAATLGSVLRQGRMKTQFESNRSRGLLSNDIRADVEFQQWGIPKDSDPEMRPVYGYMAEEGEALVRKGGFLNQYGDVVVVLKDDVRERTTVTFGDSLDVHDRPEAQQGMPVDEADWRVGRYSTAYGSPSFPSKMGLPLKDSNDYAEAQVHGGVHTEDIDHVVLPAESAPTMPGNSWLKRLLEKNDVPYVVQDERRQRATMAVRSQIARADADIKRTEEKIRRLEAREKSTRPYTYDQGWVPDVLDSSDGFTSVPRPEGVRQSTDHFHRRRDEVNLRDIPPDIMSDEEKIEFVIQRERDMLGRIQENLEDHKARLAEIERLFDVGELADPVDVHSMSKPKLRDWFIEVRLREANGEVLDHLHAEASEEAGRRGSRGSEGVGVAWPGTTHRGQERYMEAAVEVYKRLRDQGTLPPGWTKKDIAKALSEHQFRELYGLERVVE